MLPARWPLREFDMGRQDWRTAPTVVGALEREFGAFDCDVAADDHNHVCPVYLTLRDGSPNPHRWGNNNFCNPPFGDIAPFVVAAAEAVRLGKFTTMLTHANPNSPWFHVALGFAELRCPDRRLCYWHPDEPMRDGRHGGAARDSVIWRFGGEPGLVSPIHIPPHKAECERLTREAQGQLTIGSLL